MSLKYRIFLHSYLGFNSNSTLIYGEKDAVLVDASQLLSDSYKMAGEILRMRVNLTHIYVSHFHPDHHFGLQVLHFAFPNAKIVALPLSVTDIVFTSSDKVDMWAIDRFGPGDIPKHDHDPRAADRAAPRARGRGDRLLRRLGGRQHRQLGRLDPVAQDGAAPPTSPSTTATCGRSRATSSGAQDVAQGHRPADGLRPAHRRPRPPRRAPSCRSSRRSWRTSRARYTDCVDVVHQVPRDLRRGVRRGEDRRRTGRGA